MTDSGHCFYVLTCLKKPCQPCFKVLILVHQGADTALHVMHHQQTPAFIYVAQSTAACTVAELVSLFSRWSLHHGFSHSLNGTQTCILEPNTLKDHKLVFPQTPAWANCWALVRKVVLLSFLAGLEQKCRQGRSKELLCNVRISIRTWTVFHLHHWAKAASPEREDGKKTERREVLFFFF